MKCIWTRPRRKRDVLMFEKSLNHFNDCNSKIYRFVSLERAHATGAQHSWLFWAWSPNCLFTSPCPNSSAHCCRRSLAHRLEIDRPHACLLKPNFVYSKRVCSLLYLRGRETKEIQRTVEEGIEVGPAWACSEKVWWTDCWYAPPYTYSFLPSKVCQGASPQAKPDLMLQGACERVTSVHSTWLLELGSRKF